MQVNIITLGVNNLARSTEFYSKWLQIKPANSSNEHVKFFNLNGVKLSLFPRNELAKDANVTVEGDGFRGITLSINVDSKEDVDNVFSHGINSGGKAIKKPESVFWGGYSGYLSDPDGQLWEIAWNPHFKKDKNGGLIIP